MKTIIIILILIYLFPYNLKASDFKTVTHQPALIQLVSTFKKTIPRFTNLNPDWVKKIQVSKNGDVLFLSDCDIDLPYNLMDDQNYEFPIFGSGGCALTVVIKKKGMWIKAFNQQVISFNGEIKKVPRILKLKFLVHGIEFGKSGYEYQMKTVVIKR